MYFDRKQKKIIVRVEHLRRRQSTIALIATTALVVSVLFASIKHDEPFLLGIHNYVKAPINDHRQLPSAGLSQFIDPVSVAPRSDSPIERRKQCQIVYIMGVEGATHHGFLPIIEALAKAQVDPTSGLGYAVDINPSSLKAGLFGWGLCRRGVPCPPIDDPAFVQRVIKESCPDDGQKHVMIEWQSFPSGQEDDRRSYRVHRQHEWRSMTPHEIAASDEAQRQPANMTAFVEAYSPYADIKFVVLSRPYLETIASHAKWDGNPEAHSNIISGFLLILRRFLDAHPFDSVDGGRLWTMVCVERVMAKFYENDEGVKAARQNIMSYLADFLGWPMGECPDCFNKWHDSLKDPMLTLTRYGYGPGKVDVLLEHKNHLDGVWPPPGEEGVVEQQCGL